MLPEATKDESSKGSTKKKRYHSLPATESLIFDVANFMLQGNGASTSREIVEHINFALEKSRRYTAIRTLRCSQLQLLVRQ